MTDAGPYTGGRIAVANLASSIDDPELRRAQIDTFDDIAALYIPARLAERFHRFAHTDALFDRVLAAGHPGADLDPKTEASILKQAGLK